MCIINNFPVGLCCYGCFEPDRCIGRKFVTHSKATFPLTVIDESANQLIQTGGGISRSIVNTKQIFYVRKFFLEYNGARFGTGGLCFSVYYRNWMTERTFDLILLGSFRTKIITRIRERTALIANHSALS